MFIAINLIMITKGGAAHIARIKFIGQIYKQTTTYTEYFKKSRKNIDKIGIN